MTYTTYMLYTYNMPKTLTEFPSNTKSRPFGWSTYADGKIYQFGPEDGVQDPKKFRAAANAWATRNGYVFSSEIITVDPETVEPGNTDALVPSVAIQFTKATMVDAISYALKAASETIKKNKVCDRCANELYHPKYSPLVSMTYDGVNFTFCEECAHVVLGCLPLAAERVLEGKGPDFSNPKQIAKEAQRAKTYWDRRDAMGDTDEGNGACDLCGTALFDPAFKVYLKTEEGVPSMHTVCDECAVAGVGPLAKRPEDLR